MATRRTARVGRRRRGQSERGIGVKPAPLTARAETGAASEAAGATSAERDALSVTHWFEAGTDGEPYPATVRFAGRRVGVSKPGPGDTFVKDEAIDQVVPGTGPLAVTTWVYGLRPGEWRVTAELVRRGTRVAVPRPSDFRGHSTAASLPRAAWSWRRWAVASGPAVLIRTRWAPLVRLSAQPAVVRGSWSGLIAVGVLVGALVQTALLAGDNIPAAPVLAVDLLALLSGLLAAKAWYVAQRPRAWRQRMGEGWSVDGLLVGAPLVAVVALPAFGLPIGEFLDASAPALFIGVGIGRWGCFLTGCCAGRCTRSRWGVWSSDRRIGARRIPTQLLESATGFLIGAGALALVLADASEFAGAIFVAAVATYVLVRQLLLRLRAEPHDQLRARLTALATTPVLLAAAAVLVVSWG